MCVHMVTSDARGCTRTCFVVSSSDVIVLDCSDSEFDG